MRSGVEARTTVHYNIFLELSLRGEVRLGLLSYIWRTGEVLMSTLEAGPSVLKKKRNFDV
jgi:hypothetical protein